MGRGGRRGVLLRELWHHRRVSDGRKGAVSRRGSSLFALRAEPRPAEICLPGIRCFPRRSLFREAKWNRPAPGLNVVNVGGPACADGAAPMPRLRPLSRAANSPARTGGSGKSEVGAKREPRRPAPGLKCGECGRPGPRGWSGPNVAATPAQPGGEFARADGRLREIGDGSEKRAPGGVQAVARIRKV